MLLASVGTKSLKRVTEMTSRWSEQSVVVAADFKVKPIFKQYQVSSLFLVSVWIRHLFLGDCLRFCSSVSVWKVLVELLTAVSSFVWQNELHVCVVQALHVHPGESAACKTHTGSFHCHQVVVCLNCGF